MTSAVCGRIPDDLINPRRAVALRRFRIFRQIQENGNSLVLEDKVNRLVLLMVGVGEKHTGGPVESEFSVRPGIIDPPGVGRLVQAGKVRLAMLKGSKQGPAEQLIGP